MTRGVQKNARIPTCHPDRPHYGRNLCKPCYLMRWRIKHGVRVKGPHEPESKRSVPIRLPAHPMPRECGHCHRRDGLYPSHVEICCRWCGWAALVEPIGGFRERDLFLAPRQPLPAL